MKDKNVNKPDGRLILQFARNSGTSFRRVVRLRFTPEQLEAMQIQPTECLETIIVGLNCGIGKTFIDSDGDPYFWSEEDDSFYMKEDKVNYPEIEPCRRCGAAAGVVETNGGVFYRVICVNGHEGAPSYSQKGAILAWKLFGSNNSVDVPVAATGKEIEEWESM